MSNVVIQRDSSISVDGTITGYCVVQEADGTVVRRWHNNGRDVPKSLGHVVAMPKQRYSLASGDEFETDFLKIWNSV
jgi:hypothetical protein